MYHEPSNCPTPASGGAPPQGSAREEALRRVLQQALGQAEAFLPHAYRDEPALCDVNLSVRMTDADRAHVVVRFAVALGVPVPEVTATLQHHLAEQVARLTGLAHLDLTFDVCDLDLA